MCANDVFTKKVEDKTVVVSVDIGGGVGLELDGDVSHGGVEPEARSRAAILAQDVGHEIVTVVEGQQVILAHMKTAKDGHKTHKSLQRREVTKYKYIVTVFK